MSWILLMWIRFAIPAQRAADKPIIEQLCWNAPSMQARGRLAAGVSWVARGARFRSSAAAGAREVRQINAGHDGSQYRLQAADEGRRLVGNGVQLIQL
jgi:hypothetical protein